MSDADDAHHGAHHGESLQTQIELHRRLASVYQDKRYRPAFSRLYQTHWNRRMCTLSGLGPGDRVLDYGCGTGILFPALTEAGFRSVGLDLSFDMLQMAPREGHNTARVCADGSEAPFADATFDGVFCRGSIHHLPDLAQTFVEIRRMLKPGGVLLFSEPSNDSIANLLARRVMYSSSDEFHEDDEGFRRREIIPMLEQVGFDIDYSRGFGFLAYTLAGFPDKLPVLNYVPGATVVTRALIAVDNLLEHIPWVHTLALHWQLRARKPA